MATDPRSLRDDAPLLDAWLRFQEDGPTAFTIPGHKHRTDLVGDVITGDVPYYAGLDTMKLTRGVLADAEARAARLWGADRCRFSVGGSTHGNQALALAVGGPGDRVVVARTLHRSLLLGLVFAGLEPVWVTPSVDPQSGMPRAIDPAALTVALDSAPDAVAVFVGDPSYVGTTGTVGALAEVAHGRRAGGIPLIVDQAWGAHFGFHPALPRHALAEGADALVTSAHKTLPAWSQGALVLTNDRRLDPVRLDAAIEATATTSPAGAILASIDASRALLEREGEALLGRAISLVQDARRRLSRIQGLIVVDGPEVDPMRLVLVLPGTGADGNRVEQDLLARGLPVELADRDTISAIVTLADHEVSLGRLVEALEDSIRARRGPARPLARSGVWGLVPRMALTPRDAFFAPHEAVSVEAVEGRVAAELIAPYPPGIPVLAPGEVVTAEVLGILAEARAAGQRIAYAADPTGRTIRVVAA